MEPGKIDVVIQHKGEKVGIRVSTSTTIRQLKQEIQVFPFYLFVSALEI